MRTFIGRTPKEQWVDVDDELAAELRDRLTGLGFDGELADALPRWAGSENLEERVRSDGTIDRQTLDYVRNFKS